jgi:small subunit ribosomal protein S25
MHLLLNLQVKVGWHRNIVTMPFMKGRAAVRYTPRYLEAGKLLLKDNVRIMTINYNTGHKASKGA